MNAKQSDSELFAELGASLNYLSQTHDNPFLELERTRERIEGLLAKERDYKPKIYQERIDELEDILTTLTECNDALRCIHENWKNIKSGEKTFKDVSPVLTFSIFNDASGFTRKVNEKIPAGSGLNMQVKRAFDNSGAPCLEALKERCVEASLVTALHNFWNGERTTKAGENRVASREIEMVEESLIELYSVASNAQEQKAYQGLLHRWDELQKTFAKFIYSVNPNVEQSFLTKKGPGREIPLVEFRDTLELVREDFHAIGHRRQGNAAALQKAFDEKIWTPHLSQLQDWGHFRDCALLYAKAVPSRLLIRGFGTQMRDGSSISLRPGCDADHIYSMYQRIKCVSTNSSLSYAKRICV